MEEILENEDSKNVKSIEKAFNILLCFDWDSKELSLTEISKKMNMAKSTASRLINTMVDMGFLSRNDESGKYNLGNKVYYLGQLAKETLDLRKIALPSLEELTKLTRETSHIYIYQGMERTCFEQIESPQEVKQSVRTGSIEPLWQGATGKAILAFLDEQIWSKAYNEMKKHPYDQKYADKNVFFEELKTIRGLGYSVRGKSPEDSVGCIAVPIFDISRRVSGSLGISTPAYRFPEDIKEYLRYLLEESKKISEELGYTK